MHRQASPPAVTAWAAHLGWLKLQGALGLIASVPSVAIFTLLALLCGYAVPFMEFERERETLEEWAAKKSDDGIAEYQAQKNATSIDGLPGTQYPK